MIVKGCKSYGRKCPCVDCEKTTCKSWTIEEHCDTRKMCKKAREYCETLHQEEGGVDEKRQHE